MVRIEGTQNRIEEAGWGLLRRIVKAEKHDTDYREDAFLLIPLLRRWEEKGIGRRQWEADHDHEERMKAEAEARRRFEKEEREASYRRALEATRRKMEADDGFVLCGDEDEDDDEPDFSNVPVKVSSKETAKAKPKKKA